MPRRKLTQWVAVIHWDATHSSPAIGPFDGDTSTVKANREIRKSYRSRGLKPPKIEWLILREPDMLTHWCETHAEEDAHRRDHPEDYRDEQ